MAARPDLFVNRREAAKLAEITEDVLIDLRRRDLFPKPDFTVFVNQPRWRRITILTWKMTQRQLVLESV